MVDVPGLLCGQISPSIAGSICRKAILASHDEDDLVI